MTTPAPLVSRHFVIGWIMVLAFLSLGLVLEALHGFKLGFYLDVDRETRRLMWTLAHAHGGLFGLVHIACAVTFAHLAPSAKSERRRALASRLLTIGTLAVPLGFFLGGVDPRGADPGLGILLVPPGGALLLAGVALILREARAAALDR